MTNPLTAALRANLDPSVADYIDAALADLKQDQDLALQVERDYRATLEASLLEVSNRLTEAETLLSGQTRDDRYALTKAKLVQLMKDMGYFD